jgi:hypothetical protein
MGQLSLNRQHKALCLQLSYLELSNNRIPPLRSARQRSMPTSIERFCRYSASSYLPVKSLGLRIYSGGCLGAESRVYKI